MSFAPMSPFATAREQLAALQARRISATELLELQLARIRHINPEINAVTDVALEDARQAASAAQAALEQGDERAMLGLPMTVKDVIEVKGLRATAGVPQFAEHRSERDAPAAARLRAAGAVLFGKTNVPPYCGDWQADNEVFGRTVNPWDVALTPGGSSGGSAAALATGMTPLGMGSDIGGSIRIPAAFCGVYGHKTSEGIVPYAGHFPDNVLPNPANRIAVIGPLARSAADLKLAMQQLTGPGSAEQRAWRLTLPPARATRLADLRVALMPRLDWLPLDDEIQSAIDNLARMLRDRGATVGEAFPAELDDMYGYYLDYQRVEWGIVSVDIDNAERSRQAALLRVMQDSVADAVAEGMQANSVEYVSWHLRRARYQRVFADFFQDWDLLLAPCAISNAFPHSEVWWAERTVQVNGSPASFLNFSAYAGIATFAGLPSTAFPAGRTRDGLPIGLQAIGPYLEDETCLTFAELAEVELGGFTPPPAFAVGS